MSAVIPNLKQKLIFLLAQYIQVLYKELILEWRKWREHLWNDKGKSREDGDDKE